MTVISFSRRNDHDYLLGWWVELAGMGVSIHFYGNETLVFGALFCLFGIGKKCYWVVVSDPFVTVVTSFDWSVIAVGLFGFFLLDVGM